MLETVFVLPLPYISFDNKFPLFQKNIYILNTMCFFAVSSILLRHLSYHPSIWSGQKRRRQMQIKVSKLELCFVSVNGIPCFDEKGREIYCLENSTLTDKCGCTIVLQVREILEIILWEGSIQNYSRNILICCFAAPRKTNLLSLTSLQLVYLLRFCLIFIVMSVVVTFWGNLFMIIDILSHVFFFFPSLCKFFINYFYF